MADVLTPTFAEQSRVTPAAIPDWRERLDIRAWPLARRVLAALFIVFIAKQMFNVFVFPPFSGHDEVAHYAYIRTVAEEHRVPVLPDAITWAAEGKPPPRPVGDYLPDDLYKYCNFVLGWQGINVCELDDPSFVARPPHNVNYSQGVGAQPVGYQYAANHPPLYYMMMTPLYWISSGATPETQLYLFRAAAIPFGLITILFAYLLVRLIFPNDTFLAITVPAFVAFQPQISYEAAMVNNDIVAIASFSVLLYLLIYGIRKGFTTKVAILCGFALGIALLSKGTGLVGAPLMAVAMILGIGITNVRGWVTKGAIAGAVAGAIVWPWYLFLYREYGNLNGFDQIQALQWFNYWTPRGQDKPTFWDLFWNRDFAEMRWRETWGYFGWRRLPLGDGLLWAIGVPMIAALAGLVAYAALASRDRPRWIKRDAVMHPSRTQVISLVTLLATCVIAYLAIIQFGLDFALTQARYYFPAINAVALLLMLGLRMIIPMRWHNYGQGAIVAALLLMNIVIYSQYVIPYRLEGWL
jgi:4-amino-4-deoxy-L-arabinose transferase-like glycosyltransferase